MLEDIKNTRMLSLAISAANNNYIYLLSAKFYFLFFKDNYIMVTNHYIKRIYIRLFILYIVTV